MDKVKRAIEKHVYMRAARLGSVRIRMVANATG